MTTKQSRSFTLPEEVCQYLDELPGNSKSRFVSQTLRREVRNKRKRKALEILDSIVPMKNDGTKSSVDLVREVRDRRREDIINSVKNNV